LAVDCGSSRLKSPFPLLRLRVFFIPEINVSLKRDKIMNL
jgi:hypothetical protein